ncbi:MAG: hypothetical protein JOY73_12280 [Actinobacteria bacterium]|nr:hypothetical protein [Actinomycetota bacterium]
MAAVGAGAAMAASATHSTSATVTLVANAKFGKVLAGSNGRTLYRYTLDGKGVNKCTGNATCAKYWPQLLVKAGTKPSAGSGVTSSLLGTIKAAHGMAQVTYAGFPLYYFAGDKAAGQVGGQGFESQWYVVNAKGAFVKHAVSSGGGAPAPTTTSSAGGAWA